MTVILDDRFKLRRGTAADLAAVNEVPLEGEIVYETDQGLADGKYKIKIGDGVTHYNDLAYVSLGGGVESVVPGGGIAVDATDPKNPIVSSTLGSIALSGSPATYSALPTGLGTGDAGKAYLVQADGFVYIWSGAAFPANGAGVDLSRRNIVTKTLATTFTTTSTSIAYSTSIPTKTQGDAITGLTVTITPRRSSSLIRVRVCFPLVANNEAGRGFRFALFRDSATNATAVAFVSPVVANNPVSSMLECYVSAGSTAATTFSVRWGVSSGTGYLGRDSTINPLFGGSAPIVMTAEEV